MPSAVAPPLVTKPDNIELAVHHGNQINKSLWHDSSPLQALQRAKPQHGHSCLPIQELLSVILECSLEDPCAPLGDYSGGLGYSAT